MRLWLVGRVLFGDMVVAFRWQWALAVVVHYADNRSSCLFVLWPTGVEAKWSAMATARQCSDRENYIITPPLEHERYISSQPGKVIEFSIHVS